MSKDSNIIGYYVKGLATYVPDNSPLDGEVHMDCVYEGKKRGIIKKEQIIGTLSWEDTWDGDAVCMFCGKEFNKHYRHPIVGYGAREMGQDGKLHAQEYCLDCVTPEVIKGAEEETATEVEDCDYVILYDDPCQRDYFFSGYKCHGCNKGF